MVYMDTETYYRDSVSDMTMIWKEKGNEMKWKGIYGYRDLL
mgnify:CR=1 FL=1